MPNRIIKESICTSDSIDALTAFEEVVFYRLIVNCDDFGRLDARPKVLVAKLFPLKDMKPSDMEAALQSLVSAGLITLYQVDGKPYLQMNTWDRHQTRRANKSKYPGPDEGTVIACDPVIPTPVEQPNADAQQQNMNENLQNASESDCIQLISIESKCPRIRERESRIENENETRARGEPATASATGENPFADSDDSRPSFDTVEAYAANNLAHLSPGNMQELQTFKADLAEDLIRRGIDEACANGKRSWSYVRAILNRYIGAGYKTVGDARAAESPPEDDWEAVRQRKLNDLSLESMYG